MPRKKPPLHSKNRYTYDNPKYDRPHGKPGPTAVGNSRAVNRRGRKNTTVTPP